MRLLTLFRSAERRSFVSDTRRGTRRRVRGNHAQTARDAIDASYAGIASTI
jgi:hypothetical protein